MNRFNKANITRGLSYLKRNGVKNCIYKVAERLDRDRDEENYDENAKKQALSAEEIEKQRLVSFDNSYKISILMPVYETLPELLMETLRSVASQSYGNWELCIADASGDDSRRNIVRDFCEEWNLKCSDKFGSLFYKVKYEYLNENLGISGNTNAALEMATGDYITLLDHDDLLSADALFEFMSAVSKIENSSKDMISRVMVAYSDEDKVSFEGDYFFDYHKKPDFDIYLLRTNNYICHLLFVDTQLAKSVGGFRKGYDGAQDHDFVIRCTEGINTSEIIHIPKVLYHWRSTPSSTAENPNAKLYAYEAGKRAIEDHLTRVGIEGVVENTEHLGFFHVDYKYVSNSVLTMSSEPQELAKYSNMQVKMLPQDYILVVSNKLHSYDRRYVNKLVADMVNSDIGAVTGRIIGKNGRIESAGYDRMKDGQSVPRFEGLRRFYSGYLHRAKMQQLVGDFSGDLVLLRREAVESLYPQIVIKPGFGILFEPSVELRRR